jgi:hypothetical protein
MMWSFAAGHFPETLLSQLLMRHCCHLHRCLNVPWGAILGPIVVDLTVEAKATRVGMAAVRATTLVMMAATVGVMMKAIAAVHLVSTEAAAALATQH